jgi:hypothetical protein
LGTPAFVNINIDRLPSGSLISQHVPEARPASIENGLCILVLARLAGRIEVGLFRACPGTGGFDIGNVLSMQRFPSAQASS